MEASAVQVRDAARFYRSLGWNPLPSSRVKRHPIFSYANLWCTPVEPMVIEHWPVEARNIQLMCGRPWGLVVVDLDGPGAIDAWRAMTLHRGVPRTWTVRTGSGGIHLYFRLAEGMPTIPRAVLWRGPGEHEAIEVLGERSLVIAPPSLHHQTGDPYEFMIGPSLEAPGPAPLPAWLATRVRRTAGDWVHRSPVAGVVPSGEASRKGPHFGRRAVLAAIRDKVSLVRSWGLRLVGSHPGARGWWACRSVLREDRNPSCGFHVETGYYCEPAERLRLSLFDLSVILGIFPTWVECCNTLGSIYL